MSASPRLVAVLALTPVAACQAHTERDFVYGPHDAIERTYRAAVECGVALPRVEKLGGTSILRVQASSTAEAQACLKAWVVANEREARFPPK